VNLEDRKNFEANPPEQAIPCNEGKWNEATTKSSTPV